MKVYKKNISISGADWAAILSALRTGGDTTLADQLDKKFDNEVLEKALADLRHNVRKSYVIPPPDAVVLSGLWYHIPSLQLDDAGNVVNHVSERLVVFRPRRSVIGVFKDAASVDAWFLEIQSSGFEWNGRSLFTSTAFPKLKAISKKYIIEGA